MKALSLPLFESPGALLDHVKVFDAAHLEFLSRGDGEAMDTSARRSESSQFNGRVTMDGAFALARSGWSKGLPRMKDALKLARAPYEYSVDYEMPADVEGPIVDPAAYFAGIPECCHTPREVPAFQVGYDGVEVVINAFVSAMVPASAIYARGATAILLAHVCSMSGVPCRIVQGFTVGGTVQSGVVDVAMVLSDWDAPLDFPELCYWMCHPSATRRVGFRLLDSISLSLDLKAYTTPRNTAYAGGDRHRRIVINHGLARDTLETPEKAIAEVIKVLTDEGKVEI